jgi:hypothetical protein
MNHLQISFLIFLATGLGFAWGWSEGWKDCIKHILKTKMAETKI